MVDNFKLIGWSQVVAAKIDFPCAACFASVPEVSKVSPRQRRASAEEKYPPRIPRNRRQHSWPGAGTWPTLRRCFFRRGRKGSNAKPGSLATPRQRCRRPGGDGIDFVRNDLMSLIPRGFCRTFRVFLLPGHFSPESPFCCWQLVVVRIDWSATDENSI